MAGQVPCLSPAWCDQLFPKGGHGDGGGARTARVPGRFSRSDRPAAVSLRSTADIATRPARWPGTSSTSFAMPNTSWSPPGRATSMVTHHFAELFAESSPRTCVEAHEHREARLGVLDNSSPKCAAWRTSARARTKSSPITTVATRCASWVIKSGSAPAALECARPRTARDGHRRGVLRVRRHVFGEVRRDFRRHGAHQDRVDHAHRRETRGLDRFELPDADCRARSSRRQLPIRTMHLAEVLASR